ncbi:MULTISPECIES: GNAT family N-acetyltransferase [Cyanophyceae]|nr:GNAT family N-acetyltransferase [Phormidium sp. FACHB-77]MBD1918350.1 GNAT family N-acetyltransferase [Phormidium sp. FACHB-77]MBD2028781.1 GNAT family N-acetyltransferase [Phormidium sp. FACHB-322]MBD2051202.1 GNAT family N-acetyltransferase [Leptolyngbya sp. FACHB-60]
MIRPILSDDTEALIALAGSMELFSLDELQELRQMLTASLSKDGDSHPFWLTDDDDGLVALAYCEPERMTDGTWNLQLIAVHPTHQRQGRGAKLLRFVEQTLAERGARLLLVETLGTPDFEYAQAFYHKNGYEKEARIREFYAEGADKIVFCKALSSQGS